MKTKIGFLILGLVLGIGFGFFVGVYYLYGRGGNEEFRFCNFNLAENYNELQPQLREYLKARLYWTGLVYVMKGYYPEHSNFDYGPVDEEVLKGISRYKEVISDKEVYELAVKKHNAQKATIPK